MHHKEKITETLNVLAYYLILKYRFVKAIHVVFAKFIKIEIKISRGMHLAKAFSFKNCLPPFPLPEARQ